MAEHEDDICVLEKEDEPLDPSAFHPALCNPHLNPVAAPPELASHHALSTAYTTLKARYNDLEEKYKSMSRSYSDLSSSKRIRPSSSSSDQTTDMAFAAAAESLESGPEYRAKQGYVQYMERELHKIKIELQTLSMIKSSLDDKVKYLEEKNKIFLMEKDSLQSENDKLKANVDRLLEEKKTLDEQFEKSREFDEMKFRNMQKDFENEKLKLRQEVEHWKREYDALENAPPVISCRKCAENEKKFLKLQTEHQKLTGSVPMMKNNASSKGPVQIMLTDEDYKEFVKLKEVTISLKRTVIQQRDTIHHLLRTSAAAKKGSRQFPTSMPARLPSRDGEENAEYFSKPHRIPLPSVSEGPVPQKQADSTIQPELNRNLVPVTHPVSKPAFSDPVSHESVRYTPESSVLRTSPSQANRRSSSPLYYPHPNHIDTRHQELKVNRRASEQNQHPAFYGESSSRRNGDTYDMNVTHNVRTNHFTGSAPTNVNVSDFVIVNNSRSNPGADEEHTQLESNIPEYMRAGFPISSSYTGGNVGLGQPDLPDYVRLAQHSNSVQSIVSDCARVSNSSVSSNLPGSVNSTCDVNSRKMGVTAYDTGKINYNLLEHPRWSESGLQPANPDPFINSPELPPLVEMPRNVDPIVTRSDSKPVAENTYSTSSAYICPVCSIDFSYLSLDEFQKHVFDCFEQSPDTEQQTLQPEIDPSFSNRVCPMCDSAFPETMLQNEFEKHVNGHFDLDFQVI